MTKAKRTSMKPSSENFEEDMKKLEAIVSQISKGSLSLDESIKLFEQGMELSKKCSKKLNQAEKKVQKIINSNTDEDLELEDVSSHSDE